MAGSWDDSAAVRPGAVWWAACLAVVVLASACAGALAALHPDLLHLERLSHPGVQVALAAALAFVAVLLRHPRLAFLVLLVLVYANLSQVLVRYHDLPSALQLLVLPLGLAAWVERTVVVGRRPRHGFLTAALVAYAGATLLSTTVARDADLAGDRVLDLAKAMAVFLLVLWLASSVRRIRAGAWTILATASVLASLGAWQELAGRYSNEFGGLARIKYAQIWGTTFEPRIAGPLGDPNFFAQTLLIAVPLGLALAWSERHTVWRALAWAGTALTLLGAALTYSRGAALAAAVVLVLSVADRRVPLRHLAVAGLLALALAALLPAGYTRRLTTLREILPGGQEGVIDPDSSFQERKLYAEVAWRLFLDHPLVGVGGGNYTVYYEETAEKIGSSSRFYDVGATRWYPHNLYLEAAAETGLLGLAALAAALGAALVAPARARRRFLAAGRPEAARLARGFQIALVGYLVSGLFLHDAFPRHLWLLFGFAAALDSVSLAGEEAAA